MSTQSIVVLRKEKGFSQGDLSLLAGIHKRKISRFETGQQEPTRAELRKIKKALARKRAPNCLRLLRNLSGKTQAQAAQETGINRIKISEAERGLCKLTLSELERLSKVYNINNLDNKGGKIMITGEEFKLPKTELVKKINSDANFHREAINLVLKHSPMIQSTRRNAATGEIETFETPDRAAVSKGNDALADAVLRIMKTGRI